MKRPAYTCPSRPPLVRKMTIPRIQMQHSWRVAQRRPMRSQSTNALLTSQHKSTMNHSYRKPHRAAPPTLPIWTIAEMFPSTLASSVSLILSKPRRWTKCVLLRVPEMRPSSIPRKLQMNIQALKTSQPTSSGTHNAK